MNDRSTESREAIKFSREALRNGAVKEARQWAERAAELDPRSEDPWLILATIVSPPESMHYIRKALEINPNSPRAKQGMEWALQRLGETPAGKNSTGVKKQTQNEVGGDPQKSKSGNSRTKRKPRRRSLLFPVILIMMGCAVFLFAAWSAVTSPALASILNIASAPVAQPTPMQSFAQVNIPKPTYAPQSLAQANESSAPAILTSTPVINPTQEAGLVTSPQIDTPTSESIVAAPTNTASLSPTETLPTAIETPGVAQAEIVADTPTSEYIAPTSAPYIAPQAAGYDGEHWIDVDLSQQRVYAYAGNTVVKTFLVSTGTWQTPTVTGKFKIWIKLRYTDMSGPGYYLPDVPYTMYFYKDYGLHGTYWHNNFGTPMSHGCVNLSIPDSEWLYNFSSVGTVVNVHY
jgi:lipoprotein-anchoring transpeptidase ErfK/SrfK